MASSSRDISASVKIYPRSYPTEPIVPVAPNEIGPGNVPDTPPATTPTPEAEEAAKGKEWIAFGLNFSSQLDGPAKILDGLGTALDGLEAVANIISSVLQIMQFFVNSFFSLTNIIDSAIGAAQNAINSWLTDLSGAGVFMNIIYPPAFYKSNLRDVRLSKLSTGGFKGFLTRLGTSFYNTSDPQRPDFSEDAVIGGLIILVDSSSADQFFASMNTLNDLFDFQTALPIQTDPPPPSRIKAYTIREVEGDGAPEAKYKIKVEWDGPSIKPMFYRVKRSNQPGGIKVTIKGPPKDVTLKEFFKAVKKKIQTKEWDPITKYVYDDELKDNIVNANPVTGGGSYIDENVEVGKTYYYVVESGYTKFSSDRYWGKKSNQAIAKVQTCVPANSVGVVEHEGGIELDGNPGIGVSPGSWSSIQIKHFLPGFVPLIDQINKLINTMRGTTVNSSKTYGKFVEGIIDRIENYKNIVEALTALVEKLTSLELTGNVAFLNVPPEEGGVSNFMERVKSAQPPEGINFSGKSGITAGITIIYGSPNNPITSAREGANKTKDEINEYSQEMIEKAINILLNLFSS